MYELDNQSVFNEYLPFEQDPLDDLPAFPTDALPEYLPDLVRNAAEFFQVSEDMIAIPLLAVISVCCQGKYVIRIKDGYCEPVNLYLMEVADPSKKKSPTVKYIVQPVYDYLIEENRRRDPEIKQSQRKIRLLKKQIDAEEKRITDGRKQTNIRESEYILEDLENQLSEAEENVVKPLKIFIDDFTPEALGEVMRDNDGRAAVINAEGDLFKILAGAYSNGRTVSLELIKKAYTVEYYSNSRVGSGSYDVEKPQMVFMIATQFTVLKDVAKNKDFRGEGVLARFMYSIPPAFKGEESLFTTSLNHDVYDRYQHDIKDLLSIPDTTKDREILLDKDVLYGADLYYRRIRSMMADDELELDWGGKLFGNTMRIAALLHIMQHGRNSADQKLSLQTLSHAIKISDYFISHSKAVFALAGMIETTEERNAKYVIKRLLRDFNDFYDFNDYILKRDLIRRCQKVKDAADLEAALIILENRGYIRRETYKPGKGRPQERVFLNPAIRGFTEENRPESTNIPDNRDQADPDDDEGWGFD